MEPRLLTREVIPFTLSFAALAVTALLLDALLHYLKLVWIGRYLGIVGTALILASIRYSLRKHKVLTRGDPITLLRQHEYLAWLGSVLVLVHAGVHFNSILGWLAVWAMLIGLVFYFPHLMVAPGSVVPAHAAIATDCFACHAVADIGLRSTTGSPIGHSAPHIPFHQQLQENNCTACHTEHAGPILLQAGRKAFSHALLRSESGAQCQTCHRAPTDPLHNRIAGNCAQCHSQTGWKPATFNHDKLFTLDRDHDVACATCHVKNDYSRYTCYGCHQHTPQNVLREHRDEGIRDLDNCVRCHRSADGEGGREED